MYSLMNYYKINTLQPPLGKERKRFHPLQKPPPVPHFNHNPLSSPKLTIILTFRVIFSLPFYGFITQMYFPNDYGLVLPIKIDMTLKFSILNFFILE